MSSAKLPADEEELHVPCALDVLITGPHSGAEIMKSSRSLYEFLIGCPFVKHTESQEAKRNDKIPGFIT